MYVCACECVYVCVCVRECVRAPVRGGARGCLFVFDPYCVETVDDRGTRKWNRTIRSLTHLSESGTGHAMLKARLSGKQSLKEIPSENASWPE